MDVMHSCVSLTDVYGIFSSSFRVFFFLFPLPQLEQSDNEYASPRMKGRSSRRTVVAV